VHCNNYPKASLLGLSAELRQNVLLLSFDIREILHHRARLPAEKLRRFRVKKIRPISERLPTSHEQIIMERLNNRISVLHQVTSTIRDDFEGKEAGKVLVLH
jgi:hypothetical protein